MLLPLLFVIVAALFATLAQRMGREMAALPPLRGYTINLVGSLAGVAAFGVISWLQLSPTWWFGVGVSAAAAAAAHRRAGRHVAGRRLRTGARSTRRCSRPQPRACPRASARGALWSPYYKITVGQEGPDTVVEVNNIFHQSMAPVEQKEYFYQWPYMVFGDTFENVLILGAGSGHRRRGGAPARREARRRGRDRSGHPPARPRAHPDHPYSDPRVTVVNDDARHFLRTTTKKYDLVVFALIDSLTHAVELLGRAARELHVHRGVVPRGARSPDAERPARRLQLLPRALARRSAGEHRRGGVRRGAARPRARGARVSRRADGRAAAGDADGRSGGSRSRHRVRAVACAEPGAHASRATRRSSPRPTTGRSSICAIATCPRHYARGARAHSACLDGGGRDARRCAGQARPLVVAVLPARRRLHAARDEVDHPVRAAVGIDVGRGVAGDRRRCCDGAGRELHRREGRDHAVRGSSAPCCVALLALNYRDPGRPRSASRAASSSRCSTRC